MIFKDILNWSLNNYKNHPPAEGTVTFTRTRDPDSGPQFPGLGNSIRALGEKVLGFIQVRIGEKKISQYPALIKNYLGGGAYREQDPGVARLPTGSFGPVRKNMPDSVIFRQSS